VLIERYQDNGVSGRIDMHLRLAGGRLLADARRGLFDEVWVWKIDRLGRDDVDPLVVWKELDKLGIKVVSATENVSTPFEYAIRVAMAAEERRNIIARTTAGMNRAAAQGKYTGGVVPYGYRVEGEKPNCYLVPCEDIVWGDMTAADVVRLMYGRVGLEKWSCRQVAQELDSMGVPTAFTRLRRGIRGKRTSGRWDASRIRNMLVEPRYKGELSYGRRARAPREVIKASLPPLVSVELWDAAQQTLKANRIMAKNTRRTYFLKSLVRCAMCGLKYCGARCRNDVRYRCNGGLMFRGLLPERCKSKSFYGRELEPHVKADIEAWLRNPGDLIDVLASESTPTSMAAENEAQRITLEGALAKKREERDRLLDGFQSGLLSKEQLKERFDEIAHQEAAIGEKLAALVPEDAPAPSMPPDLLAELRRRLDEGLDDQKWQEIASLLVREIVIHSEGDDPRTKTARAVITYRFPDVVKPCTGRDSWRSPA
jgi:site-specific DNA recombinase